MIDTDNNAIFENEVKNNNNVDEIVDVHVSDEVLNDESKSIKEDSLSNKEDIKSQCLLSIDNPVSIQKVNERIDMIWHCFFATMIFLLTFFIAWKGGFDFGPHISAVPIGNDFVHPIQYFKKNSEPLFHYITRLVSFFLRISTSDAGAIVLGCSNVMVFEIIRRYFIKVTKNRKIDFFVFACMISASIWVPWINKNIYIGNVCPNTWHNPTILMVRPFAYYAVIKCMNIMGTPFSWEEIVRKKKEICVLSIAIFFSVLAKPCFVQFFFPAIFFFCVGLVIYSKGKYLPNAVLLLISCLPSLFLLLSQIYVLFLGENTRLGGGMKIQFMEAMKISNSHPILCQIISCAFPLSMLVYIIYTRKHTSKFYKFSWIMFLCAFLECALLIEDNARKTHGNFAWGLVLASSIIFTSNIGEYIKMLVDDSVYSKGKKCFFTVSTCLFITHVIVGIVWIYRIIVLRSYL